MPFGKGRESSGQGIGRGTRRRGRGRMGGNRIGVGPGGFCVCPSCGKKVSHQPGVPCYSVNCPKCGNKMIRE